MKSQGKVNRAALVDVNGKPDLDAAAPETARTRKPPSVRQREQQAKCDVNAWLQGKSPMDPDSDRLLAQALAGNNPIFESLMSKFESVLVSENWDLLSAMLDSFDEQGLRFDAEPVKDVYLGRRLAQTASVRVLTETARIAPAQSALAIRLLDLGCSPNAADGGGNTVLMRACAAGDERLARHILEHCKDADIRKRNADGKNAAGLAKGKPALLALLAKAGLVP